MIMIEVTLFSFMFIVNIFTYIDHNILLIFKENKNVS